MLNRRFLDVDTPCMDRIVGAVALAVALLAPACSVSGATDDIGTLDGPSSQACADAQSLAQAVSAGTVSPSEVQTRAARIDQEAQASANPILQAKAVALFVDSTSAAMGGQEVHLQADLQALSQTCAAANR
jgi:hypothetical protein